MQDYKSLIIEKVRLDIDNVIIVDSKYNYEACFLLLHASRCKSRLMFIKYDRSPYILLNNTIEYIYARAPVNLIKNIIIKKKRSSPYPYISLTPREILIMKLSSCDISIKNIALILKVKIKTIYTHRRRICQKYDVSKFYDLLPYKDYLLQVY